MLIINNMRLTLNEWWIDWSQSNFWHESASYCCWGQVKIVRFFVFNWGHGEGWPGGHVSPPSAKSRDETPNTGKWDDESQEHEGQGPCPHESSPHVHSHWWEESIERQNSEWPESIHVLEGGDKGAIWSDVKPRNQSEERINEGRRRWISSISELSMGISDF